MQACSYNRHSLSAVTVGKVPMPRELRKGTNELLIKVHSASLNPADWKSCNGEQQLLLSFDWPRVFGFDFSGEVVQVAKEGKYKVGDRVFGMIKGLPERVCFHYQ